MHSWIYRRNLHLIYTAEMLHKTLDCLPYNSVTNDSRTDVSWQKNCTEQTSEVNMLRRSRWFTDRRKRGLKTRSVAQWEQMADLKNRHRRKASKQLVTGDLHCKNGSILLYRHIFSQMLKTSEMEPTILIATLARHQRAQEGAIRQSHFTDKTWRASKKSFTI